MNFYKLLVSSKYIPRRNFRYSTSEKDYKLISSLLRNNFFRKILFIFSKIISNKSQLSKSLKNRLFEYQFAPQVLNTKYLVDFNKNYYLIDYSHETKKCIVIKPNETITTFINVKDNFVFSFSIAVLENLFLRHKKILNNDYKIKINILDENKRKLKELNFQLPINDKKHGLLRKSLDTNWIDLSIDLNEFLNQSIYINLSIGFTNHTFTMFNRKNKSKKSYNINIPCFAIGNPNFVCKKNQKRKILYISGESLTDPFYVKKNYNNVRFPNIEKLARESIHYNRSYSIGDSTLPTIMAFKTGLFPSQHGFGDYSKPVYEDNQSEDIITIASLLKEQGFLTKSISSYPDLIHCMDGLLILTVIINLNILIFQMHLTHLE